MSTFLLNPWNNKLSGLLGRTYCNKEDFMKNVKIFVDNNISKEKIYYIPIENGMDSSLAEISFIGYNEEGFDFIFKDDGSVKTIPWRALFLLEEKIEE